MQHPYLENALCSAYNSYNPRSNKVTSVTNTPLKPGAVLILSERNTTAAEIMPPH
jgi:hypothetical protein